MKIVVAILLVALAFATPVSAQTSTIVDTVKQLVAEQKFSESEQAISGYRAANGVTPLTIEALAVVGRAALTAKDLARAERLAREAHTLAIAALKTRRLDAETHLPIGLGAAIETIAQVQLARGSRSEAIGFLNRSLAMYRGTSIEKKIQKNINLVTLEGTRAPALDASEYLGTRPPSLASLRGQVVLLFFWAHWCSDCKAQSPIIANLMNKYGPRGLTLVAPTQRYGYVAEGKDANPAEEKAYIETVQKTYYPALEGRAMPLATANHLRYGVSSTPTIALVDRQGIVRVYHPGRMTEEELDSAITKLLP